MVTQPVAWLGLLGALLVVGDLVATGEESKLRAPANLTILLWALLLFLGSRTPLIGFPQRFGRDVGIPLAILAALAFVAILRSLKLPRKPQGCLRSFPRGTPGGKPGGVRDGAELDGRQRARASR